MAIKPLQMPDLSQLPDPTKDMFGGMTSPTALMTMGDKQVNDLLNPKPLFEQNVKLSSQAQQTLNGIAQQQQALATETDHMAEQVRRQQQEAVEAQIKASQNQVKENERRTIELLKAQEEARKEKAKEQGDKLGAGADGSFVLRQHAEELIKKSEWQRIVSNLQRDDEMEMWLKQAETKLREAGVTDEAVIKAELDVARNVISGDTKSYTQRMKEDNIDPLDLVSSLGKRARTLYRGAGVLFGASGEWAKSEQDTIDSINRTYSNTMLLDQANYAYQRSKTKAQNPDEGLVDGFVSGVKDAWNSGSIISSIVDNAGYIPYAVVGTAFAAKGIAAAGAATGLTGLTALATGKTAAVSSIGGRIVSGILSAETAGAAVTSGLLSATDAASGAYDSVMALDFNDKTQLAKARQTYINEYGQANWDNLVAANGGDMNKVKSELAIQAGRSAGGTAFVTTAPLGVFGLEATLAKMGTQGVVAQAGKRLLTIGANTVSETLEEGFTQLSQNVGAKPVTGVALTDDVGATAAMGAIAGGGMSAGSQAVAAAMDARSAYLKPTFDANELDTSRWVSAGNINYDAYRTTVGHQMDNLARDGRRTKLSEDDIQQLQQRTFNDMVDNNEIWSRMTPEQQKEFKDYLRLSYNINSNDYARYQETDVSKAWASNDYAQINNAIVDNPQSTDLLNAYRVKNNVELEQVPQKGREYFKTLADVLDAMATQDTNVTTQEREVQSMKIIADKVKGNDKLTDIQKRGITMFMMNSMDAGSRRMTDEQQAAYDRVQQAAQQVQANQQVNQNGTQEQNQTSASQPAGQGTVAENAGTVAPQGSTNGAGTSDTLGTIAAELATVEPTGQGSNNTQSVGNDPVQQTPVASNQADNTTTSGTSTGGNSQGLGQTSSVGNTQSATTPTSNSGQITQQGVAGQTSQTRQSIGQTGPSTTQTPVSGGSVGTTPSERNTNGGSQQTITQADVTDSFLADPANETYVKSFINVAYNDLGKFGQGVTKHKADLRRLAGITGVDGGKLSDEHIDKLYDLINMPTSERTTLINNEFRTQAATNRVHNAVHHLKQNTIKAIKADIKAQEQARRSAERNAERQLAQQAIQQEREQVAEQKRIEKQERDKQALIDKTEVAFEKADNAATIKEQAAQKANELLADLTDQRQAIQDELSQAKTNQKATTAALKEATTAYNKAVNEVTKAKTAEKRELSKEKRKGLRLGWLSRVGERNEAKTAMNQAKQDVATADKAVSTAMAKLATINVKIKEAQLKAKAAVKAAKLARTSADKIFDKLSGLRLETTAETTQPQEQNAPPVQETENETQQTGHVEDGNQSADTRTQDENGTDTVGGNPRADVGQREVSSESGRGDGTGSQASRNETTDGPVGDTQAENDGNQTQSVQVTTYPSNLTRQERNAIAEVAKFEGVPVDTVYQAIADGNISFFTGTGATSGADVSVMARELVNQDIATNPSQAEDLIKRLTAPPVAEENTSSGNSSVDDYFAKNPQAKANIETYLRNRKNELQDRLTDLLVDDAPTEQIEAVEAEIKSLPKNAKEAAEAMLADNIAFTDMVSRLDFDVATDEQTNHPTAEIAELFTTAERLVRDVVGDEYFDAKIRLITRDKLAELRGFSGESDLQRNIMGFHRNGKIYLLPENFQQRGALDRIVKTAVHEAGHEKIFASGRQQWHDLFKAAYESNPTLKAVADKQIEKYRKVNYGSRAATDIGFGIEEAIVDMYGYLVNDMYYEFKQEYGVDLPVEETRSFFKDLFAKLRMMFAKLTGWKPSEFSDQDIITIISMINNVDTVTPTFSLGDKLSLGGLPTEMADTLMRMWNAMKQVAATVSVAMAVTLGSTFVVPNEAMAATPVETATVQHIVQTNDNQGKSFIVADKQAGTLTVYNAAGQELTSTPALFGKNVGDSITAKNTTPSGRYDLTRATNINNSAYGNSAQVLTVNGQMQTNNAGNLAIHRVLTSFPSENRVGRLDSATASDNRISNGCINVPTSFYDAHLDNVGDAVVYVLPETEAGRTGVFSGVQVPAQQTPAQQTTTVEPQMDNANAQSVEVKSSDIQSAPATYSEPKQAPVKALAPVTIAGTQPSGQVAYVAPVVVGGITADQINVPFDVHTPAELQANGMYDTEPVSGSLRSDGGNGFNIYEIAAWLAGIGATAKTVIKRRKKKLASKKGNEQPTTDNANEETVTSEQNPSGTDRNEQAQATVDDNHNDKVNKSADHVVTNAQAPSQKTQIADAVTRAMWLEYIANSHLTIAKDENGNMVEGGDVYFAFVDSMLGFEWAIDDVMRDRTIEQANDGTFADPLKWRNEISNKGRAGVSAKLMNWAAGATQAFDNLMTEHGIARVGHEMDSSIPSKHLAQIKAKARGADAQIHKLYVKPLVLKVDMLAGNLRMGYVELENDIGRVATVKHVLNEAADAMWRGREHIIRTHQEQLAAVNQAIDNTAEGNEVSLTLTNKARLLEEEIQKQTELLNKARDMYNGVIAWDGKTGMPGGYTKAQAEKALADLKTKYGSNFSQVEQLATETVQTIRGIRNFAAAAGVFSNADLQTFHDLGFTEYVPLYAEQKDLLEVDETNAYTKQSIMDKLTADLPVQEARAMGLTKDLSRYHREGAISPAADAFTNMKVFSLNMAGRIGQQGWLNCVQQLYEGTVGKPISATGITDEALLKELNASPDSGKLPGLIRVRPDMEKFAGIDTSKLKPIVTKGHNSHGEVVTYHYYFTEPAIQAEIYSNSDLTETLAAKGLRNVGTLTRFAARMMTTFKPVWVVYNWARDSLERISIMLMRPVKGKDGNLVNKWDLSKAYFKNLAALASSPSAQSEIYRYLVLGETKTKLQKILHEAVGEGAINLMTSQAEKRSIMADLNKSTIDKLTSQVAAMLGEGFNKAGAGKIKRGADQLVDMYIMRLTEVPQITTALAAYMAYQDVGVNKGETANRVRDQYDPARANNKAINSVSQLFPFTRSVLSGHYNLARTLSEYWKPGTWQAPLAYMVVGTLGTMAVLTMMSAMFGDDEDGVPKIARLPIGSLMNGIPVPTGDGGVWSLPVGFGMNKLVWGIGANLWRQSMGMQTGGDTSKQLLGLVVDNTSPIQFASGNITAENPVTGMALTFTPLIAKPLMEIATNTKSFGGAKIINRETPKDQYDSDQDNFNMPETYKTWVRALRETTGIDMRPETMRHLIESYSWGPLGAVPKSVIQDQSDKTLGNAQRKGEVFGPLLTAIGADMSIQPNALDYAKHTYAMQDLRMELHKRYGVGEKHSEEVYEQYADRGERGGVIKRADVVTERAMRDKGVPDHVIQYVVNGMRYNEARQEANENFTKLSQKYYELRQQGKDDPVMRMAVQSAWDELEDLTYNFVKENNRAYFEIMQQQ